VTGLYRLFRADYYPVNVCLPDDLFGLAVLGLTSR
jgi:hypothetical protein